MCWRSGEVTNPLLRAQRFWFPNLLLFRHIEAAEHCWQYPDGSTLDHDGNIDYSNHSTRRSSNNTRRSDDSDTANDHNSTYDPGGLNFGNGANRKLVYDPGGQDPNIESSSTHDDGDNTGSISNSYVD